MLYIPLAMTAIRCTRCVIDTIKVLAGAGATYGAFHWVASERDTLREQFAIR